LENLNCSIEPITFRNQKGDNLVYWHERYFTISLRGSGKIHTIHKIRARDVLSKSYFSA
jgi:hypothetical protein